MFPVSCGSHLRIPPLGYGLGDSVRNPDRLDESIEDTLLVISSCAEELDVRLRVVTLCAVGFEESFPVILPCPVESKLRETERTQFVE